ncbi:MAG: hypothetical protein LBD82_03200, partial [Deltaproteobacteria bacterium]|nr:hypothetical protein [Deltaproteobacteria bacterium]
GFRFFLDALGGRARMEWPGTEPKNRRIEAVKVEGLKAQCRLEGFERMVRLERIGRDELRVTDGDEALVFERGK